jgi:proline iminopeptidase
MDQRGCGRSVPRGRLAHNTTSALVDDIDAVRRHLGISQWLLLGGSWGVALALAYAQAYPDHVLGLILRGVCLMRPEEIHWMYGGGAAALKPLSWEQFIGHLLPHERTNPLLGYYKRLLSSDASVRDAAVSAVCMGAAGRRLQPLGCC